MAEAEDDKVRERYRALGRDEPPLELDARIVAAARRAAETRPPRRRWVLPAAIAALVVLSVSVVVQLQREPRSPSEQAGASIEAGKAAAPAVPGAPPAAQAKPSASEKLMQAPALERRLEEAPARAAAKAGRLSGQSVETSPGQWLARIAELRRAGRDKEADRELAEFRRRFPHYRIPQALRKEIEPR